MMYAHVKTCKKHVIHVSTCSDTKTFTLKIKLEPADDKTYTMTCATSEDSDQPVHPRSLITVFADHRCLLQPRGYRKRATREPMRYWVDVQTDLSLRWSQRAYCRFCHALALMIYLLCCKDKLWYVPLSEYRVNTYLYYMCVYNRLALRINQSIDSTGWSIVFEYRDWRLFHFTLIVL